MENAVLSILATVFFIWLFTRGDESDTTTSQRGEVQ
jgi:hypothetical protein